MGVPKTRLILACPCCDGEVTKRIYSFTVIQPPKVEDWFVCTECEAALKGDDPTARATVELAFLDYLEGRDDAPAA